MRIVSSVHIWMLCCVVIDTVLQYIIWCSIVCVWVQYVCARSTRRCAYGIVCVCVCVLGRRGLLTFAEESFTGTAMQVHVTLQTRDKLCTVATALARLQFILLQISQF